MVLCTVFLLEPNNSKSSKKANYIHFVNVPRIGEKVLISGVLWRCNEVIHNPVFGTVEIYLGKTL